MTRWRSMLPVRTHRAPNTVKMMLRGRPRLMMLQVSEEVSDGAKGQKLWEVSEKLVGLA